MSFESELQRIKDQIIQHLPPEIVVKKIEFVKLKIILEI